MSFPGTDPSRLLHRVLMGPVFLDRLPRWLVGILLALASITNGVVYGSISIAAIWLLFLLVDWALLTGLHKTKRSFGPVVPSLLALAVVRTLVGVLFFFVGYLWPALALMGLLSIIIYYSTWVEPFDIRVTEIQWSLPHWSPDASPVKLLHLGDLHLEREGILSERLEAVMQNLSPDIICFSGDLLNLSKNQDPIAIQDVSQVLNRWHAPYGVYATTGSPLVDTPSTVAAVLENCPNVHWLQNEAKTVKIHDNLFTLVGLTCSHNPETDGKLLEKILKNEPNKNPIVLIYHTPDLAPEASQAGVDLQLSGHTHGGQIRAPLIGALVTSSLYGKRYEMGLYHVPRKEHAPMTLYVSRGIGMEGGIAPRARFLCRPEIVLWTLMGCPGSKNSN
ncbi:MAG: metallophosphoesterase [Anaerolineales bacterium]|nr:metallophosphoesterase [Anaerolineales bacterium]